MTNLFDKLTANVLEKDLVNTLVATGTPEQLSRFLGALLRKNDREQAILANLDIITTRKADLVEVSGEGSEVSVVFLTQETIGDGDIARLSRRFPKVLFDLTSLIPVTSPRLFSQRTFKGGQLLDSVSG